MCEPVRNRRIQPAALEWVIGTDFAEVGARAVLTGIGQLGRNSGSSKGKIEVS